MAATSSTQESIPPVTNDADKAWAMLTLGLFLCAVFLVFVHNRERTAREESASASLKIFHHPGNKRFQEVDAALGVFSFGHGILTIGPGKWTPADVDKSGRQNRSLENLSSFLLVRPDLRVTALLWMENENLVFIVEKK